LSPLPVAVGELGLQWGALGDWGRPPALSRGGRDWCREWCPALSWQGKLPAATCAERHCPARRPTGTELLGTRGAC